MIFDMSKIAVKSAIISYFCIAFLGILSGMEPFTCCKRALIASLCVYAATMVIAKAINALLISAIVNREAKKQEDIARDDSNE